MNVFSCLPWIPFALASASHWLLVGCVAAAAVPVCGIVGAVAAGAAVPAAKALEASRAQVANAAAITVGVMVFELPGRLN